jgi:hypothetical protein
MEPEKIRNPKTGRYIDVYGPAYQKLLKEGYTEQELLKQPKIPSTTKNIKILSTYKQKKEHLQSLLLPDEILFEEVIMKMDTPDFMPLCKTNKKFLNLCQSELFWEKMYYKHFGTSEMKELLPDMTWLELFKTCYGIYRVKKRGLLSNHTIKQIYTMPSVMLTTHGISNIVTRNTLKNLIYLHSLRSIIIKIDHLTNLPMIPSELNQLPFLTTIKFEKI